ncbi:MAG: phosphatase PAP2 family protein [Acidobacteria bacterium]|nr:phosphatase PAP2 family protein [Acidobacteriota bacterium]
MADDPEPDDTEAPGVTAAGDAEELRHDQFIGPVDLTRWRSRPGRALAGAVESASRNLGSRGTLIMTLVVGGAIAVAFSFLASRVYDAITEAEGVAGLDMPILLAMMGLRSPVLDVIVTGYTDIAGPVGMPILAVVAILILSLRRRSWTPAILIASAGIGSLLMTIAGKDLVGRVRPPLVDAVPPYEYSPSFPSGHTLNAVVIAGVVAYLLLLRRRSTRGRVTTVVVAAVFALTIGLSRVFLGHHWFTDVLAGWVLGAAWLALIITAHRLYITARTARAVRAGAAAVGE